MVCSGVAPVVAVRPARSGTDRRESSRTRGLTSGPVRCPSRRGLREFLTWGCRQVSPPRPAFRPDRGSCQVTTPSR